MSHITKLKPVKTIYGITQLSNMTHLNTLTNFETLSMPIKYKTEDVKSLKCVKN